MCERFDGIDDAIKKWTETLSARMKEFASETLSAQTQEFVSPDFVLMDCILYCGKIIRNLSVECLVMFT